jgi:hypothetical protein
MLSVWLNAQEANTLKEDIRGVGLQEYSFIGGIYDPLIVVVNGSNRTRLSSHGNELPSSPGLYILASHYRRLILSIALALVVAGLLVGYLLGEEAPDEGRDVAEAEVSQITVDTLGPVHKVDVIVLAASAKGVLASVGLDRQICVWRLKGQQADKSVNVIPSDDHRILWPVAAIAIDDQAEWLAILPRTGDVSFWNISTSQFGTPAPAKHRTSGLISFFFAPRSQDATRTSNARLIMVRKGGLMTEVEVGKTESMDHQITNDLIIFCQPLHSSRQPLMLVSSTRDGIMHATMRRGKSWVTQTLKWSTALPGSLQDLEFVPVRELGMLGLIRSLNSPDAHLLDVQLCESNPKNVTLILLQQS